MIQAIVGTVSRMLRSSPNARIEAMRTIPMRALIFQDSGRWYAQCLDFDICVQAATTKQLLSELIDILSTYTESAVEQGREPFAGLPRAPQQFFEMYERSVEWDDSDSQIQTIVLEDAPRIVPTLRVLQHELT